MFVVELLCAEESSLDVDQSAQSSVTSIANFNFSDGHWRVQQLKKAFMLCVRHRCPLVIHGPPGSGRTSMTAAICQFCRSWLSSPHAVVAARVLASSPACMTIEYVLSTICFQISEVGAVDETESVSAGSLPHHFTPVIWHFPGEVQHLISNVAV